MSYFRFLIVLAVFIGLTSVFMPATQAQPQEWLMGSRKLLAQAQSQPDFAEVQGMNLSYLPTSDGKSYLAVWLPQGSGPKKWPKKWIISLPGTQGYATRDIAVWAPHLKGRDIGVVSIQWWLGAGDSTADYYAPRDIYRELDKALAKLGVQPGSALLHGFSRGSANIYAVAALDRTRGHHYFSMIVANAGSAMVGYPPTGEVHRGVYGAKPYASTQWVTACGEKDPNPDRDGCPAMRKTAEWIRQGGGEVVLTIEDPTQGHGALHRNADNTRKLLDLYMQK